jgi:hypothetical protein
MARWRQAVELAMTDEEIGKLTVISRSRTEPASRVERAQMLLAYGGRLSAVEFEASEDALVDFIKTRGNTKPHLADLT